MELAAEQRKDESRFIAKVYGYVALGLIMTAFVAFSVGALFAKAFVSENFEEAFDKYVYLMIGAGIALLIDTIVMRVVLLKNNRSGWVPYIIYCALFGIFLSSFVVMGIPFRLFGEAFAISALVFFILFVIGYFSPINLNIIASIGLSLLFGAIILGLFFVLITAFDSTVFESYDLIVSGLVLVVMLILIAADAYNVKRLANSGSDNENMILWCASNLYTDFIYIFIRVLWFLLKIAAKAKK